GGQGRPAGGHEPPRTAGGAVQLRLRGLDAGGRLSRCTPWPYLRGASAPGWPGARGPVSPRRSWWWQAGRSSTSSLHSSLPRASRAWSCSSATAPRPSPSTSAMAPPTACTSISSRTARAFAPFAPGTAFDLAEVLQSLIAAGGLAAFEVEERFYEIGSEAGYLATDAYLRATLTRARTRERGDGQG